jgi:hypothetical protein
VKENGVLGLIELLTRSDSEEIKEQAAGALHNLAIDADTRGVIVQKQGLPALIDLLTPAMGERVQEQAIGTLRNISVSPQYEMEIVRAGAVSKVSPPHYIYICVCACMCVCVCVH